MLSHSNILDLKNNNNPDFEKPISFKIAKFLIYQGKRKLLSFLQTNLSIDVVVVTAKEIQIQIINRLLNDGA